MAWLKNFIRCTQHPFLVWQGLGPKLELQKGESKLAADVLHNQLWTSTESYSVDALADMRSKGWFVRRPDSSCRELGEGRPSSTLNEYRGLVEVGDLAKLYKMLKRADIVAALTAFDSPWKVCALQYASTVRCRGVAPLALACKSPLLCMACVDPPYAMRSAALRRPDQ